MALARNGDLVNIGIVTGCEETSTAKIDLPLARELQRLGHTVETFLYRTPQLGKALSDFDVAFYGWFDEQLDLRDLPECPTVATIHHVVPADAKAIVGLVKDARLNRLIVNDRFWQQWWGMHEEPSTVIPLAFDHTPWYPLALPDVFSVGFLGVNYSRKRSNIIIQAADRAGVPFVDGRRSCTKLSQGHKPPEWLEDPLDFYKRISCYVVASFIDTGPLPPQEALLCGRPVITTCTGMMPEVVTEGTNGLFYDGFVPDLVRKIQFMEEHIDSFHARAIAMTYLPTVSEVAKRYERIFQEVIDES
jgi:glycosyltransferase involved in cell wall biosynthesis